LKKMLKMELILFKVSDVNTSDGFGMPPQLPSPYPCNNCDMDSDDWEKILDDYRRSHDKAYA